MRVLDTHSAAPEVLDSGSKIFQLVGTKAGNAQHHSISHMEFMPGDCCREHYHPEGFEESYYILQGEALVPVNKIERKLSAGQCISIPPLVWHDLKNIGNGTLKFLVITTPAWTEKLHMT